MASRPAQLRDDGAEGRILLPDRNQLRAAHPYLGVRMVLRGRGDDRADHGELVPHAGLERQQFADLDAGDVRRNGLELAADFRRRVRLQVVRVQMRRATQQENVDDGLAGNSSRQGASLGSGAEQVRQSERTEGPNLEEIAAADAVAEPESLRSGDYPHKQPSVRNRRRDLLLATKWRANSIVSFGQCRSRPDWAPSMMRRLA